MGIAAFVTIVALFYAEENWRGQRDWAAYKQGLSARGIKLSLRELTPPSVPDDENFAMTPFLAPLFDFNPKPLQPGQSFWRDTNGYDRAAHFAAAFLPARDSLLNMPIQHEGRMTDLEDALRRIRGETNVSSPAFKNRAQAAEAVLAALDDFKPVLDELRTASRRPYSRFNLEYDAEDPAAILLPHLAVLARVGLVLQVRASAELALGKGDMAFDDACLMFYLADSLRGEMTVVSLITRMFILKSTQSILWEGLAQRRWSDAQLRDFQSRLEKLVLVKDLILALNAERAAFGNGVFDYIRNHPYMLKDLIGPEKMGVEPGWLLAAPRGWLYQEQLTYQRFYDRELQAGFDPQTGRIRPRALAASNKVRSEKPLNDRLASLLSHRMLATFMFPDFSKLFQKTAIAQTGVHLAALACALERHRIARGHYPDSLASLQPAFINEIPLDSINDSGLHYHLREDGQFILYSLGWNGTDDGGKVVMGKDEKVPDTTQGDWVWPFYSLE